MAAIQGISKGRSAAEVLAATRDVVDPALRAAIDTLPASMRRIAGYHFGWFDEHGRPARSEGGKALRSALVLLAAEAAGHAPTAPSPAAVARSASAVAPLPAAVAVELVHNFALLHDDVMDGDITRRHRPTAWSAFGVGMAILAGDSLLTLAFDMLAASGHPAAREGMRTLNAAVQDLMDGQSMDMAFEQRADVDLAECLSMARAKTGALMGCACALGALFGGGNSDTVGHLRRFGEHLGLAFQVVDDLLGIWGDPAVTGKPIYSDLHNRKKSVPVVAALTSDTPAGRELAALYQRDAQLSSTDLAHAAELIDIAGGRAWSQDQADDLLEHALRDLRSSAPNTQAAAELYELARLATRRDR